MVHIMTSSDKSIVSCKFDMHIGLAFDSNMITLASVVAQVVAARQQCGTARSDAHATPSLRLPYTADNEN